MRTCLQARREVGTVRGRITVVVVVAVASTVNTDTRATATTTHVITTTVAMTTEVPLNTDATLAITQTDHPLVATVEAEGITAVVAVETTDATNKHLPAKTARSTFKNNMSPAAGCRWLVERSPP